MSDFFTVFNLLAFALSIVLEQMPGAKDWWKRFEYKREAWVLLSAIAAGAWLFMARNGKAESLGPLDWDVEGALFLGGSIALNGQATLTMQRRMPEVLNKLYVAYRYMWDMLDSLKISVEVKLAVACLVCGAFLFAVINRTMATITFSPLVVRTSPLLLSTPWQLTNPGLEGAYYSDPNKGNIMVANGWRGWWQDAPLCYKAPCVPQMPASPYLCPDHCQRKKAQRDGIVGLEIDGVSITVTLWTTRPVQAIEARLHWPAGSADLITYSVMAPDAWVADGGTFIRYQREISGSVVGRDVLFTAEMALPDKISGTLELIYFIGYENGAAWGGGWRPGITTTRRVTIAMSGSGKCSIDWGCWYAPPEMSPSHDSFRVHGGNTAQKAFVYGRQGDHAIYQTVHGVEQGTMYQFSIWAMAWQCSRGCPTSPYSDAPYDMGLRVGIDPNGGTDPLAPGIVWSAPSNSFDEWSKLDVMARAGGNTITVFAWSSTRFDWARINNDVYWDDADLVSVYTPDDYRLYIPFVGRNANEQ